MEWWHVLPAGELRCWDGLPVCQSMRQDDGSDGAGRYQWASNETEHWNISPFRSVATLSFAPCYGWLEKHTGFVIPSSRIPAHCEIEKCILSFSFNFILEPFCKALVRTPVVSLAVTVVSPNPSGFATGLYLLCCHLLVHWPFIFHPLL